jgi:hypothetical protein
MTTKPRRAPTVKLIASSFAGQVAIVVAIALLILAATRLAASPYHAASVVTAGGRGVTAPDGPLTGDAVPPYYAALTSASGGGLHAADIKIRDTMSGKVLATMQPPAPYTAFTMVAATGTATNFIVAATRQSAGQAASGPGQPASGVPGAGRTQLYLLVFNPVTRSTRIGALSLPAMDGLSIWGAALSPDNSQLAVAVQPSDNVHQIRVYALARGTTAGEFQSGGSLRGTWTATGNAAFAFGEQPLDPLGLSWSADNRTLAFNWQGPGSVPGGLRLLDTSGTGGSLIAGSRLAVKVPNSGPGFQCLAAGVLTADGKSVLCGGATPGSGPNAHPIAGIGQFSVTTGQLLRQFAQPLGAKGAATEGVGLLWTGPTGKIIVVGQLRSGRSTAMSLIGPGSTKAIPLAPDTAQVAW